MTRKDIAFTVTGVVATMALAYLFYRQQQKAAAAAANAAQTAQDVTDPNAYTTTQDELYAASLGYQAGQNESLSSASTVSPSMSSSVDTSAATAATGGTPDTDGTDLLSQIIAAYYANQNAPSSGADFSSLEIPTLNAPPSVTTSGIPTTATDALNDAQNMISTNTTSLTAAQPNAAVSAPTLQAPSTSSPGPGVHDMHIASGAMTSFATAADALAA